MPADQVEPKLPAPATHYKISDLDRQLRVILDDKDLGQREKVRRYRETLDKYLHFLNTAIGRVSFVQENPTPRVAQENEPPQGNSRENLQEIIATMTTTSDILSHSPSGEIIYHGHAIPGTNILDILQQQLYPRGQAPPAGNQLFETAMQEIEDMENDSGSVVSENPTEPDQTDMEFPNEHLIRDAVSRRDIARILRLEKLGRRIKMPTKRSAKDNEDSPRAKRARLSMLKLKSKHPRVKRTRPQASKPNPRRSLSTSRKLQKRPADQIELRPLGPRTKYLKPNPPIPMPQARVHHPVNPRKRASDKFELRYQSSRPKRRRLNPRIVNVKKRWQAVPDLHAHDGADFRFYFTQTLLYTRSTHSLLWG